MLKFLPAHLSEIIKWRTRFLRPHIIILTLWIFENTWIVLNFYYFLQSLWIFFWFNLPSQCINLSQTLRLQSWSIVVILRRPLWHRVPPSFGQFSNQVVRVIHTWLLIFIMLNLYLFSWTLRCCPLCCFLHFFLNLSFSLFFILFIFLFNLPLSSFL